MRIVDVTENNINACCQFEFRGWTVSVSTIFKKIESARMERRASDD